LPPVRQVATDLGVNLNTIAAAYRELQKEGLLKVRHGAGAFVSSRRSAQQTDAELRKKLRAGLTHLAWQVCRSRRLWRSSTKRYVSYTNLTASFGILRHQLFGSLPTRRPPESGSRGPACDGIGDTGGAEGAGAGCSQSILRKDRLTSRPLSHLTRDCLRSRAGNLHRSIRVQASNHKSTGRNSGHMAKTIRIVEGQKSKAAREWTKGPQPVWIGSREGPVKGIEGGKITIQSASRKSFVGLCQGIRARLAPFIKLILLLLAKLS